MTSPDRDYEALWQEFKTSLHRGDVLDGTVHSRNDLWLNIDIGAPLMANLDAADAPLGKVLVEGSPVRVVVKGFDDRRRQVVVTTVVGAGKQPRRHLPAALQGRVEWPPPVAHGVSVDEWRLQHDRS